MPYLVHPTRVPLVTSEYGNRFHPVHKTNKFHAGLDLRGRLGDDILAAGDGIVSTAHTGNDNGCGKHVVITHSNGTLRTRYCHLSQIIVRSGDIVSKGMKIGEAGNTGTSAASHLHFEVYKKQGIEWKTVNPVEHLPGPIPLKGGGFVGKKTVSLGSIVAVLGLSYLAYNHWWK